MLNPFKRLAKPRRLAAPAFRPTLESLEGRCLLAGNVLQTNLVSDLPGVAQFQDPNLVNPWGISESSSSFFWVADNGSSVSTLYNTAGSPQSLVVSIPSPGDPLGASGAPTGTVFNIDGGPTGGFKISGVDKNGNAITASSVFLFATEDGTIVGWNPNVNPSGFAAAKAGTYGIIAVDNSTNEAIYKGLAIATGTNGPIFSSDTDSGTVLYAANFHAGTIDVFDTNFKQVTLPTGAFTDANLPAGYAPFNVQVLNNKVYVTYAKQDAAKEDDVAGPGFGFVDVYNLDGSGEQRLVSRGALNAPWGLAIAPSSFGTLAGALLVGNFGDGRINVYNATTGAPMGQLKDPDGEPIQIDGLWALQVGNGTSRGGDADTVYFTAGLFDETHGLFGSLKPVAAGTPEGPAEQQMVTAFLDVFQLSVQTLNQDIANGASRAQIRQDIRAVVTALREFVRAEVNFLIDTHTDQGGRGRLGGDLREALDDLFGELGRGDRDRD
jgi:uncharacterized protein (TIGR03118 family)